MLLFLVAVANALFLRIELVCAPQPRTPLLLLLPLRDHRQRSAAHGSFARAQAVTGVGGGVADADRRQLAVRRGSQSVQRHLRHGIRGAARRSWCQLVAAAGS